jgi:hypothetical protein
LEIYLNILAFYTFTLLYFFSFTGYGKLLLSFVFNKNLHFNPFEITLFGIVFNLIVGYLLYFTFGFNSYFNLIFLLLGIVFFYFLFKKRDFKYILKYGFFILLFFSLVVISKTHEDFPSYHFQSIKDIFENKLTFGGANIDLRFAHVSLFVFVQSFSIIPYFLYKFAHVSIFLTYFCVLGYFYYQSKISRLNKLENFFCNFLLVILIIKFTRLSEYGYDYISQFLLLIVFHKIFFYKKDIIEVYKSLLIFILSILIKPAAILFSPLFLLLFYNNNIKQLFIKISKKFLLVFILLQLIFLSNSFIRTGCIFYPLNSSCFYKDTIKWSVKDDLKGYSNMVQLWAKGYYHQDKSKYEKKLPEKNFKENYNWIKYWIDIHFFYKISEFLLIIISIFIIFLIAIIRVEWSSFLYKSKELSYLIVLSLFSIFLWLNFVPDFRFGFTALLIFTFSILVFLFKKDFFFIEKRMKIFLCLAILFFNIKNFNRIYKEFNREDHFQFKNFPWFSEYSFNIDISKFRIKDYGYYRIIYRI